MATVKPNVLDNVNEDEIVKEIQSLYGVDPKFLFSEDEVKAIREARAQAISQQQQLATIQKGVDAIKTGAEVDNLMKPKEGK